MTFKVEREGAPQAPARAVQTRLDRAHVRADDRGRLGERKLLELDEHDDFTLQVGQLRDSLAHLLGQFCIEQLAERALALLNLGLFFELFEGELAAVPPQVLG